MDEKLVIEFEDFWDELPTIQCGEGGCNDCDSAFRATCEMEPNHEGEARVWDGDTIPSIPELVWEELGGEG